MQRSRVAGYSARAEEYLVFNPDRMVDARCKHHDHTDAHGARAEEAQYSIYCEYTRKNRHDDQIKHKRSTRDAGDGC